MRNNVNGIIKKETTGSLMKKEFISIKDSFTVQEAMLHIRENMKDKNNIHYVYIVNQDDKLVGTLSIRELLSAKDYEQISEIMISDIVSLPIDMDQEVVTKIFQDTDLVSIPVVKKDDQLIGAVHVEDILDVIEQEATKEFHKMTPVSKDLTGDIRVRDWFKMFMKEISISVMLGVTMALAVSTVGLWRGGIDIAIVVALTMKLIVIVGSLIWMSLPFIYRKLKLDPATASAPLITSIADIVGVLIYFGIAIWYLNL